MKRRLKLHRWTPEESSTLIKDFLAYVPVEDIAVKLNRSEGVVKQRILHLGLRRSGTVSMFLKWAPEHLKRRVHEMDPDAWCDACRAWREGERQRSRAEARAGRMKARAGRMKQADEIYRRSGSTRRQKMRAMRMVGLTYEEIAAFFNVTRMRVCAILKSAMQAAEIDRRRDITPEQKIKKMYATGVTYKDIAELYNVTLNRVPRRRGTVGSNAKPPAATRGCSGRLRMRVPSRLVRGTAIALTRIIIPFSATAVNPRQHRPDLHPNPDGGLS